MRPAALWLSLRRRRQKFPRIRSSAFTFGAKRKWRAAPRYRPATRHRAAVRRGLRRQHDATEGLAALDVGVRGGGLGERERPRDLNAHAAACDSLEQLGDHRV